MIEPHPPCQDCQNFLHGYSGTYVKGWSALEHLPIIYHRVQLTAMQACGQDRRLKGGVGPRGGVNNQPASLTEATCTCVVAYPSTRLSFPCNLRCGNDRFMRNARSSLAILSPPLSSLCSAVLAGY